jgi:hypothetical protein
MGVKLDLWHLGEEQRLKVSEGAEENIWTEEG